MFFRSFLILSLISSFTIASEDITGVSEEKRCETASTGDLSAIYNITDLYRPIENATSDWDQLSQPGDKRKVRTANSPKWLEAVGKLETKNRNQVGNCTIVLVGDENTTESRVAITNSHCVEDLYMYTRDNLEKANKIIFTQSNGEEVQVFVSDIFNDGKFAYSLDESEDYAIVILSESISASKIQPLVYEADFAYNYRDFIFDPEYDNDKEMLKSRKTYKETLAGYSGDINPKLGNSGKVLTYDDSCEAHGEETEKDEKRGLSKNIERASNCFSYPGASGGAYVVSYFDTEEENDIGGYGKQLNILVGINSGTSGEHKISNGQFDRSKREIVPVLNFVDSLDEAVAIYNKKK